MTHTVVLDFGHTTHSDSTLAHKPVVRYYTVSGHLNTDREKNDLKKPNTLLISFVGDGFKGNAMPKSL